MPQMLLKNHTGTRQLASLAGKSCRRTTTYAGMTPLKPRPNAAETAKRPASSRVKTKAIKAAAWQVEAARMVKRPPMRSANQPQNSRLKKALPSRTESIAAPRAGTMPRSLHSATMWAGGIAIGVQHKNPAKQSSEKVAADPAVVAA